MDLKNKIIVITGAASGLGLELVKLFSKEEAKIVASDLNEEKLKNLPPPAASLSFPADVSKEDEIKNLAAKTFSEFGKIDIWINNAGIWLPYSRVSDLDMSRVRRMFDVNVFGTIYGCRSALSVMEKQNFGTILNIISISALEPHLESASYGASKRAVDGFTKGLRLEVETYEGNAIKILSVYPGGIKTALFNEQKPDNYKDYLEPFFVAEKIISNLKLENPKEELVITS